MYYLSLCAVFKEETKYLREWIEYHFLVGVDHLFLFLHDTKEEFKRVQSILKQYHYKKVSYYPFNYNSGDFQIKAYDLCLKNFGQYTKWLGFIDLDELVFPVNQIAFLPEIFEKYEDTEIKGLNTSICTFGDSGREFSPILQTRDLTLRAFDYRPCNYTSKQFFKPELIKQYDYGGNWWQLVNEDYETSIAAKQLRPANIIRVNHYPIRSKQDWQEKVKRNWPSDLEKHKLNNMDWEHKYRMLNHNDIKDKSMNRFVPELEKLFIT